MDGDGGLLVATSPPNTGRNSLWKAHVTNPEIKERRGVVLVTICFASSGALSFVDYYTEREHDEIAAQPTDVEYSGNGDSAEYEETFPWCGRHLSGFSLVDDATMSVIPGYESLVDNQQIPVKDLPRDFALAPVTDGTVGSVRYFLPTEHMLPSAGEIVATRPFHVAANWLAGVQGPVQIRADAFDSNNERFLGSCEITIIVDSSESLSCGPGVTGFHFVDESGKKLDGIGNLRNQQVIAVSSLPEGAVLAAETRMDIVAVSFESPGYRPVHSANPPFRTSPNHFTLVGKYSVKAQGYSGSDVSVAAIVNTCEVEFQVVEAPKNITNGRAGSLFDHTRYSYPSINQQGGTNGDSEKNGDLKFDEMLPMVEGVEPGNLRNLNHPEEALNGVFETAGPSASPMAKVPTAPTVSPSQAPTEVDRRFLLDSTRYVHCDFSTLETGVYLSDMQQSDLLARECDLTLTGADHDSTGTLQIDVVNSSDVGYGMSNLGSPHSSCGGKRRVTGEGGRAEGPYPNCEAQENVLVLDKVDKTQKEGGCINIDFIVPVQLDGIGLLDVLGDEPAKITVRFCRIWCGRYFADCGF
jgi:hypothetical protein